MSDCCGGCAVPPDTGPGYRRVLWIALVVNLAMFVVEIIGAHYARSMSLWADALDFIGDAGNYAVSLAVLSMGLAIRSRVAFGKGVLMTAFGFLVLARTAWALFDGETPEPITMGAIGFLAMLANIGVAAILYAYREGDANMRSVWLCSRNDAIANIAVMVAALGVLGTGSALPDLLVAAVIAGLAFSGGFSVMRQARAEHRTASLDAT